MMQAYDSVAVEADVELGGTDQTLQPGRRKLAGRFLTAFTGKQSFTESLILAQDERWRRA